eukprot:comp22293_c0_seq1/m.53310 comp22293_c0_seq1/g.53310  ORF comp22293_c0_seq1/g.53310 comp22293_c0_seq1/m.53310 type:complete len:898 (+) comp22293_c0_seq1:39-2732(+)
MLRLRSRLLDAVGVLAFLLLIACIIPQVHGASPEDVTRLNILSREQQDMAADALRKFHGALDTEAQVRSQVAAKMQRLADGIGGDVGAGLKLKVDAANAAIDSGVGKMKDTMDEARKKMHENVARAAKTIAQEQGSRLKNQGERVKMDREKQIQANAEKDHHRDSAQRDDAQAQSEKARETIERRHANDLINNRGALDRQRNEDVAREVSDRNDKVKYGAAQTAAEGNIGKLSSERNYDERAAATQDVDRSKAKRREQNAARDYAIERGLAAAKKQDILADEQKLQNDVRDKSNADMQLQSAEAKEKKLKAQARNDGQLASRMNEEAKISADKGRSRSRAAEQDSAAAGRLDDLARRAEQQLRNVQGKVDHMKAMIEKGKSRVRDVADKISKFRMELDLERSDQETDETRRENAIKSMETGQKGQNVAQRAAQGMSGAEANERNNVMTARTNKDAVEKRDKQNNLDMNRQLTKDKGRAREDSVSNDQLRVNKADRDVKRDIAKQAALQNKIQEERHKETQDKRRVNQEEAHEQALQQMADDDKLRAKTDRSKERIKESKAKSDRRAAEKYRELAHDDRSKSEVYQDRVLRDKEKASDEAEKVNIDKIRDQDATKRLSEIKKRLSKDQAELQRADRKAADDKDEMRKEDNARRDDRAREDRLRKAGISDDERLSKNLAQAKTDEKLYNLARVDEEQARAMASDKGSKESAMEDAQNKYMQNAAMHTPFQKEQGERKHDADADRDRQKAALAGADARTEKQLERATKRRLNDARGTAASAENQAQHEEARPAQRELTRGADATRSDARVQAMREDLARLGKGADVAADMHARARGAVSELRTKLGAATGKLSDLEGAVKRHNERAVFYSQQAQKIARQILGARAQSGASNGLDAAPGDS